MERKGYEIKHGNRLGFKLRGQPHFMYPERKDKQYLNTNYVEEKAYTATKFGLLRPVVLRLFDV